MATRTGEDKLAEPDACELMTIEVVREDEKHRPARHTGEGALARGMTGMAIREIMDALSSQATGRIRIWREVAADYIRRDLVPLNEETVERVKRLMLEWGEGVGNRFAETVEQLSRVSIDERMREALAREQQELQARVGALAETESKLLWKERPK